MKKIRKIIKNNILGFVIGGILFGTIGVVCAATYFPSNDVTYDNKSSGMKATDVQSAIDELYTTCANPPSISDSILDKVPIVTTGDGLYEDEFEDGRYIFKGKNPNNYITFNGETAGWRILSIESDGTMKIMRNKSGTANDVMYDGTTTDHSWNRPNVLNSALNGTYYKSLTTTAKNQIYTSHWNIGAVSYSTQIKDTINQEQSSIWQGDVGVMTISEYVRANSNQSLCGSMNHYHYNYEQCRDTNWIYHTMKDNNPDLEFIWTMTRYNRPNGDKDYAFTINFNTYEGDIYDVLTWQDYQTGALPVVFLKSDVGLVGGTGTQSDPYQIK